MTKTILIGILVAGILAIGLTTAYAGTNIDLRGDTTVFGNLGVTGEISESSETPTPQGSEIKTKSIIYRDPSTDELRIRVLDQNLNDIGDSLLTAVSFAEIVDTVQTGDRLITTIQLGGVGLAVRITDLTTGVTETWPGGAFPTGSQFIEQIDVAQPTPASSALPVGCTAGQVPVWDPASGSWQCGIPVSALIIGGKFYPLIQFDTGQHNLCDPEHAHAKLPMAVEAYVLSKIPEPPVECGFGKIGTDIHKVTIHMSQAQIDAWNADTGLTIPQ